MLIVIALVAVVAAYFFMRWRQKAQFDASIDSSPVILEWLVPTLATTLAPQVGDASGIEKALRGDADPDVVSSIEEHVRSIDLEFIKDAHTGAFDVVVHVRFEHGDEVTARKSLTATELPASVREDFARKAVSREFRKFAMPWSRAKGQGAFER